VERTIEDMTIELTGRGHPFVEVQPRGDRNYADHTISITLLVDEGARIYVERIEIYGNTKTRDYVIRREFDFAEGDAYNRVLVDRAERRLRSTGFFKTVTITTQRGSLPDLVILVVTVVEESTGSFSVGGGYSTSDGFVGEISLTEKNFLGRGQTLRISYGLGEDQSKYGLSFTDPRFLGYNFSAGFDIYARDTNSTSNRPYSSEEYGGALRVGLPLTEDLDLGLFYRVNSKDISGSTGAPWFTDGSTLTSEVGYSLTYSTVDDPLNPSDGIYASFTQDFAGVGGDVSYLRSVAKAAYYHELLYDTDIIGLVRVQGGNVTGIGEDVLIEDNFFKGGETVRGFENFGYGARDTSGTITDGTSLGGKNYWAATAEVQFPIPLLPPDFGLRGAVFADAGSLWDIDPPPMAPTYSDSSAVRSSVGGSLMWASPFGLLRADFAYALTKESFDETQVFRFSAGTQF
jgi:outer membrane protein insertion porin family